MIQDPHPRTVPTWLEDAWLHRYLDGDLNEPELIWFETYALDKPRLIAEIENDTALRDGMHAWHAEQQRLGVDANTASHATDQTTRVVAESATTPVIPIHEVTRRPTATRFRPFAIAASLLLAGLLGASAARWMLPHSDGRAAIASPNRIVFDTMRGADSAPLVEANGDASAPLLLDIAVPAQATNVIAHFADQSALMLPVSADGFVSLTGARSVLLEQSPIRIAWQLDGQAQERTLDLATLAHQESGRLGKPEN